MVEQAWDRSSHSKMEKKGKGKKKGVKGPKQDQDLARQMPLDVEA